MSSLMDGLVTNRRCWGHGTCHSFGMKPDVGHRYQRWGCVPPALVPSRTLLQEGGSPSLGSNHRSAFHMWTGTKSPTLPMRVAWQRFRTATNPSPTCKLPECDRSVYIPPPLHSNSSQVHVKGQVYIKIVLKPLGKVGVKEKKVVGQHK